jgi:glycosyltransferase involved in cell wall biosynthesis
VSIIVPAYNHARHLPQALDSLLAQDHPGLEVIVLDDGSTDATPEVLRCYTGRLRWERQANMGQAATLNRGWRMARGELLGYLSADDLLDPTAVSTVAAVLAADPGAVLAYPDYRLVDMRGDAIKTVRAPEFDYRNVLSDCHCPPGPGALFRRDAGAAAGFWDTDLRLIPDYAFWLRLGLHGRCRRVPQVLAGYRVHEGSQTYAAVPPDRSEEYVRVTTDFYARPDLPSPALHVRRRALSSAYLMSARSHLRSARYRTFVRRALTGFRLYPGNLRPHAFKVFGHGILAHRRFGARTKPPVKAQDQRITFYSATATDSSKGRNGRP